MRVASIMTLAFVAAVVISLFGCEHQGPALQADPTPVALPKAVIDETMCLDGWEAVQLSNGAVMYRREHDVQEHLISCKEATNG